MGYEKLKDVALNREPSKMRFHYYKFDLVLLSPVTKVEVCGERVLGLNIQFNGGSVYAWGDNKVVEVRRPDNMIIECEVCFRLYNEYDEQIGYLYVPSEVEEWGV